MASQLKFPTNAFNSSSGGVPWSNVTYVYADDTSYASCSYSGGGSPSWGENLFINTYGFSIPTNAEITGIIMRFVIHQNSSQNENVLEGVGIMKSTSQLGPNPWIQVTSTPTLYTYGSSNDYSWTNMTWTPNEINSSSFGAWVNTYLANGYTRTFYCDYVSFEVFYKENPSYRLLMGVGV